jgi:ABC-type transport system involved in multi-copper enzyme maturation permease subunit
MRTVTNKALIVIIIIVTLIGFGVIPLIKSSMTQFGPPLMEHGAITIQNDSLRLLLYAFNTFGEPLSGLVYSISISTPSGELVYKGSLTTGYDGYAVKNIDFNFTKFKGEQQIIFNISSASIEFLSSYSTMISLEKANVTLSIFPSIQYVLDPEDPTRRMMHVFFTDNRGDKPIGYKIYYLYANETFRFKFPNYLSNISIYTEPEGGLIGVMDDYIFVIDLAPFIEDLGNRTGIYISIFSPDDKLVYNNFFRKIELVGMFGPRDIERILSQFVFGVLSQFIALMAILSSYYGYGRDRVKGYIDMVLARPVTRFGLALSRYFTIVLVLMTALILLILILDFSVYYAIEKFVDFELLSTYMIAFIVEFMAIIGITLVLSHIVKSTGGLIGIGIGLWAVLSLFWDLIVFLVSMSLGLKPLSLDYYRVSTYLSFINPLRFHVLLDIYKRGFIGMGIEEISVNPASYGLTIFSLIITGILWVVVPLLLFVVLASKRD